MVLSQYADGGYALELFKDGTTGLAYLLKERVGDLDELLGAIHNVAGGGSAIDPRIVEVLVDARTRVDRSPLRHLTGRELDILRVMAQGKNNAGVAEALHLSESAIEKHVTSIFLKLGVTEQPHLSRRVSAVLAFLHDQPKAVSDNRPPDAARGTPRPKGDNPHRQRGKTRFELTEPAPTVRHMSAIKALCPHCGQVDVEPHDIRGHVDQTGADRSYLRLRAEPGFREPRADRLRRRVAGAPT